MEEWKKIRLGDIVEVASGFSYKGEYIGSGRSILLGMGCVSFKEKFLMSGARPYSGESPDRFHAQPGDIVLATRQQSENLPILGMPAILPDSLSGHDVIVGANLYRIINNSEIENRFLYLQLKTPHYLDHINKCKTGTTVRMITKKNIEDYVFLCPPKEVREKIVSMLWNIEDKIDLNKRINHNLEEQAQIVFDRIFNSDLTNNCLLSSIVDINPKRTLRKNEVARCIDMTYLNTAGSFPSGWEFKPYSGGMKFINGDTLMARITPCLENGKVAYINFLDKEETAFGSTEYIVFHAKEGYPNEMFYFLTRNKAFIEFATKNMNGSSGRQRVSGETIGNYIIPVLSEDDINELKTVSESTMKEILKNNLESRVLSEMRNTILPKLMSGELKINDLTC